MFSAMLGLLANAPDNPLNGLVSWWTDARFLKLSPLQWVELSGIFIGSLVVGFVLEWMLVTLGSLVTRRTRMVWDDEAIISFRGPGRFFIALLLIYFLMPPLAFEAEIEASTEVIVRALLIAVVAWFFVRFIDVASEAAREFLTQRADSPARIRSIHTRIDVPRSILRFLAVLVGVAMMLLQFEAVRGVGFSLIASASLVGLAVTLAAQRTLANVFAGMQLAFSQPIKIGDEVVVEGEKGTIEEMNLTHVVVKTWDLRRLILPVSYFLEKPFQNWTRETSDLLGTVFLFTDYTVPVQAVRDELKHFLSAHPLWDGRAHSLQVTNLTDRCVELRVVVSAHDGRNLWELRCQVREHLLGWLQAQGHAHLPIQRIEMRSLDGDLGRTMADRADR